MMGCSERESEEQLNNYYAENTVFVAVGKQIKESESVLLWAAKKFAKKRRICILHVHQPGQLVTFFDGKLTTSKLKQRAVKAFRELDVQKLHKLVHQYVLLLSQSGVHADRMWIEMDNIEEGIVNMIVQHGIKWLVMGAAADKHYTKEMAELKSQKAIFVCEQAPASCHIWFTCRGNLIYTREGRRNASDVDRSLASESLGSSLGTKESDQVRPDDPGACLESQSLDSAEVVFRAGGYVDDPGTNILLESQPPNSSVAFEEAEHERVDDPSEDTPSLDSDVASEESESESESETESESQSLDSSTDTEVPEDEIVVGPNADSLALVLHAVSQESRHERIGKKIDEHRSPPRLTFRERSSILRACSVDFDSHVESRLVISSSQNFRTSSGCVNTEKEACHEIEGRKRSLRFSSSFNSALAEGKMAGKARLEAPREIHDRLEHAMSDAENLKHMAFQESVKRWKAEEDAVDAKNKAEAAENEYAEEMQHMKELQEAREEQKLECVRLKDEREDKTGELLMVEDQCRGLTKQIRESDLTAKELEEKILSAVELLKSFRTQRDQLQLERDKAIHEMETLSRLRAQQTAMLSGPRFSTFSLMEIGEATSSFDPSQRIGDGRYGSIYQGILRHMEVAIRMLPNDGFQGQWRFEHAVEFLSRVRHPNIVTIIGLCPEARSLVYEYLQKGSLEDHLACRGKNPSLKWQTRVRIARELCSALVFLHTNNPPIIHGNLKPTKVLLDNNFISKLGDLGVFHLIPQNQIPLNKKLSYNNTIQDSSVYMDPEYLETGLLSPDSDVYSFGVILLRLLTSRPASGIVKHVKYALEIDEFETVLDFSAGDWPVYQAQTLAQLALQCCDRNRSNRPDLASEVWSVLEALRKSCDYPEPCSDKKENRRPPSHFLCPIYQEVMKDPCTAADGFTYEGDAIRGWLDSGRKTSPMTNLELSTCDLIPNHALQYAIQEWLQGA